MAYTPAPENQTYGTHRIPVCYTLQTRPGANSTSQDAGMLNCVPIKEGQDLYAESRYPIVSQSIITPPGASRTVRGMYVWEKSPGTVYYFMVVDDGTNSLVYTATSPTGAWTSVNTLGTRGTTPVRFTEFIDSTSTKKLVMVDGIEGYVFTSNAAGTQIVDADFPTPHVPFPVFIDGYLFLAKANTGDIYNSDLNDPAVWTAGSYISSELYPDDIQAIVKVDNYLLAVGTQGCEYFYDAANATASPLARYEGGQLPFGCPFPNSIAYNKNTVMMLTNNNDGEATFRMIEGLKYKDIDSSAVVPYLNGCLQGLGGFPQVSASTIRSYFFRQAGQLFYGIAFSTDTVTNAYPVFAYSFSTEMWVEFTYRTTSGTTYTYPVTCTASTTTGNVLTYVAGVRGSGPTIYFGYLTPINLSGSFSSLDFAADPVYVEIRTPLLSFDTLNKKTMSRIGVAISGATWAYIARPAGFSYSDNDGTSWSTLRDFSSIAAAGDAMGFPFITQLGQFRQRRLKFVSASSSPVKVYYLETDINKGQQ